MNVTGVNAALSGRSYVICVNEQFIELQGSALQVYTYVQWKGDGEDK